MNDMHIFDVDTETWTKVTYSDYGMPIPSPRGGHSTIAIGDFLYIFGGQLGHKPCNELWMFDIKKKKINEGKLSNK